MPEFSFLCIIFISFARLPCSPGVTLAFLAASSEVSEEVEMNENTELEEGEEAEQEEAEYTEVLFA